MVTLTSSGQGLDKIKSDMAKLMKTDVYVGIPQEKSSRQGDPITNAELAFIHTNGARSVSMRNEMQPNLNGGMAYSQAHQMYVQEHGSELWQVPPRPIIEPVINKNKDLIGKYMKEAGQLILSGDPESGKSKLEEIGLRIATKVKENFVSPENGWATNAPSTIAAKGSDKPLIDTGSLMNSITSVVADK
jgi:hypothetical protein